MIFVKVTELYDRRFFFANRHRSLTVRLLALHHLVQDVVHVHRFILLVIRMGLGLLGGVQQLLHVLGCLFVSSLESPVSQILRAPQQSYYTWS